MKLIVSLEEFRRVVAANSFPIYYYTKSNEKYGIVAGNVSNQIGCYLENDDATSFEDNEKSSATLVKSIEDAISRILFQ